MADLITVTSPLLPPLEEFMPYLQEIWDSKRLTNGGPFHEQLEQELADYLGVKHLSLFCNGTLALVAALQALRITGEVITTPYSFVATAHSLLWNNLKPVFVDIDPISKNLDPKRIEEAITPATTAILPVHCYGIPCDVEGIQRVADTYGLKVIYDAAHAFGVRQDGVSVLNHGDLSILSFHATKVFNTFEGGAIICPDAKIKQRIDYLKNFGFADETTVMAPGINGKMNEVQAAFGLLQLRHIDSALGQRRAVFERYRQGLEGVKGISLLEPPAGLEWNYAYCPVLIDEQQFGCSRDALYDRYREQCILVRRYFYPLISEFPMYRGLPSAALSAQPHAVHVSRQVLCLPIYPQLPIDTQQAIIDIALRCHAERALA
ncbi:MULTISPECIES: DegT/DnrJ/EryC1/StrS family aminotransferase [Pseudomonas]|uniref:DegT/DnrJ/EryC1/StrS family aminotransferase n=1 Tax=Pseudomonas TaxID=286 RepID=UPI0006478EDF|nr:MULTISPECIES: DegT/DnrJ/EryC1/StrS family aminotransferase [Pseudomonas]AYN09730.1 DegT/DnrJ/EryC1/StrS family aminotransferase [Pseudomonas putida]EKT4477196.1 DegT/DnrJ/EryC1/StrS family aminotransferase [Pseudomonas putida]MCX2707316.1 DegT/DnrJ/EryC1/StrS family aminotransferase [Pseudomonas sp. DCB_BG]MDD2140483.1 DegT/DnrJ/EryC1/StrS family aminotransferase [Pseudomonas putida]MDD2144795.1 DegT/DnrJ/EryC1/StrS family aminotransferase [Pseudomonas putida]